MRIKNLHLNGKKLQFPCFFPSVSSVKTNLPPQEYLSHLEYIGYPNYLVSAYDFIKPRKRNEFNGKLTIQPKTSRSSIILLDSGNYEAYWFDDHEWPFDIYEKALSSINADLYMAYDDCWQKEPKTFQIPSFEDKITSFIPIIHGTPSNFPELFIQTALKQYWPMIAVPERELGDGITQRLDTIIKIKKELDKNNQNVPIHLLGTGNPISILLFSAVGVSSFDGLEWCQTLVNPKDGHLLHFTQKELIDCQCDACTSEISSYLTSVLYHNLFFYIEWMVSIQKHLRSGEIKQMLKKYLPDSYYKTIEGVIL